MGAIQGSYFSKQIWTMLSFRRVGMLGTTSVKSEILFLLCLCKFLWKRAIMSLEVTKTLDPLRREIAYSEEGCTGPGANLLRRAWWMKKLGRDDVFKFIDLKSFINQDGWMEKQPIQPH